MISQQTQQEGESICRTFAPVLKLLVGWREPRGLAQMPWTSAHPWDSSPNTLFDYTYYSSYEPIVLLICQLCAAQDGQSGCTGAADTCVWHGCRTMRESRAGDCRWRATQIHPASCSNLPIQRSARSSCYVATHLGRDYARPRRR